MIGATNLFGYHGQVLLIDATHQRSRAVPLTGELLRAVVGGGGLATLLLAGLRDYKYEPMSEGSALVFAFSPLVGSPLTTSAKFVVACRSPLTGLINDSLASSRFAIQGKQAGFDAIIVRGVARSPTVILIDDGKVTFQPSEEQWGQECSVVDHSLKARFGRDFSFAVIGPAGENRVRFATLSHDGRHAGRGGAGAVMGSKNLKAIGVRGKQKVSWAFSDELTLAARDLAAKSFGPATAKYRELGTLANLLILNRLEALPSRNFQHSSFDGIERLSPESLKGLQSKVRSSCAACTIGCEHIYAIGNSRDSGVRLEYESVFALGPLCGISDPKTVAQAAQRCDELGLDTISMGGSLAFAMECQQRGWLDADSLRFGDSPAVLDAIELTARREGLGGWLAEGSRRLSDHLGIHTSPYAAHIKGLELPGYDPRKLQAMAVGLAVCARGADHNRSGAYEADFKVQNAEHRTSDSIARDARDSEDRAAMMDSMILCKFVRGCLDNYWDDCARFLNLTTGAPYTADELQIIAARIIDLKKWINQQAGWKPTDDALPDRFFSDSSADPPGPLSREEFTAHLRAYYQQRNWTPAGLLSPDRQLELQHLADEIHQHLIS